MTHDEAREACRRLINSHFRNEDGARCSIPANPDRDDDLVLSAYIKQRAVADVDGAAGPVRGPYETVCQAVVDVRFAARAARGLVERLPGDDWREVVLKRLETVIHELGLVRAPAPRWMGTFTGRPGGASVGFYRDDPVKPVPMAWRGEAHTVGRSTWFGPWRRERSAANRDIRRVLLVISGFTVSRPLAEVSVKEETDAERYEGGRYDPGEVS
ncbi:hypothetical protein MKK68_02210 [Methylobacterium sp. E-016]|nr:hypothetical protein [Methylobacterium sp. E-016]